MAMFFVRALLPAWSDEHSGFDQLDLVVAIGCGVASLSCRTAMVGIPYYNYSVMGPQTLL